LRVFEKLPGLTAPDEKKNVGGSFPQATRTLVFIQPQSKTLFFLLACRK